MRALRVVLFALLWPAVALVAALSTGAAVAAQRGRVSLAFDVLAHFAPIWLLGAAAAFVASLMYRGWARWLVAVPAMVGVIAAALLVAPEFLRDAGPRVRPNAPDQLKVIQFNVWHDNPDPQAVLDWLDQERPDIAVIEENSPAFAAALAGHPAWSVACARCEVMMLSRTPAVSVEHGYGGRSGPLTHAVFRDRRGTFDVIGVHNAWPTDRDQPFQEARLADAIAAAEHDRLIVTGDFNSAPWSFARRRWDEVFGIPRRERAIPTWPAHRYKALRWAGLPYLPIDHVYAGPAWGTVSVRRGPRLSSDHYALVVTLAPLAPH